MTPEISKFYQIQISNQNMILTLHCSSRDGHSQSFSSVLPKSNHEFYIAVEQKTRSGLFFCLDGTCRRDAPQSSAVFDTQPH